MTADEVIAALDKLEATTTSPCLGKSAILAANMAELVTKLKNVGHPCC